MVRLPRTARDVVSRVTALPPIVWRGIRPSLAERLTPKHGEHVLGVGRIGLRTALRPGVQPQLLHSLGITPTPLPRREAPEQKTA